LHTRDTARDAAAREGGLAGAAVALGTARGVAEILRDLTRETYSLRCVEQAAPALAPAVGDLIEGLSRLARFDASGAEPPLKRAEAALSTAGHPLALAASYQLSICDYYAARTASASGRLERVCSGAREQGADPLLAACLRMTGLIALTGGDPAAALVFYRESAEVSDRALDPAASLYVQSLIAEAFNFLGDRQAEWETRVRTLGRLDEVADPQRRESIWFDTATSALDGGYPAAAVRFQDAALRLARGRGEPVEIADTLLWRAQMLARAGRPAEAAADFAEARRLAAGVGDKGLSARLSTESLLAEEEAGLASDPAAAVANLDAALKRFDALGLDVRREELLLARGHAQSRRGRPREARADFESAIHGFETNAAGQAGSAHWTAWFTRARAAYEAAIALDLDAGRPAREPFELAGRSRLQGLRAPTAVAPPGALPSLPGGTAVLSYFCLEDRLVSWILLPGSSSRPGAGPRLLQHVSPLSRVELERLVSALDPEGGASPEIFRTASARLHETLLGPFRSELAGARRIVVLPDGPVASVPFAGLFDPLSGRYLVEGACVMQAPSLALRSAPDSTPRAGAGLLVVGDPAFDARLFPSLAALPGASAEAEAIAAAEPGARLLEGGAATIAAFASEARTAGIIHFSGHASENPDRPGLSHLVLAPDAAGDPGALYARDLERWALPATRLVVLAACRTASTRASHSAGLLGLARPFLAAGVPTVIGSLHDLDDAAAGRFFTRLHARIRAGADPVEALRQTQLECLRGADPALASPSLWSHIIAVTTADGPLRKGVGSCPSL
jgi:tetratricopeptide (TPR) repeat protein